MTKSSVLLRSLNQSLKLHSKFRLPISCISVHQPSRIPNIGAVYNVSKCFYSSRDVAKLEKIYDGPATKNIFLLKLMSLTTSATAVILEIILVKSNLSAAVKVGWSFAGGFTFITPFLSHLLLRKYVTQMYYDAANNSYTATVYTIFATKKYITFTVDDVKPLGMEVISSIRIKGHPLFFDPRHFTNVNHYKKIMGYDKPIDLGIDTSNIQEELEALRKSKAEAKKKEI